MPCRYFPISWDFVRYLASIGLTGRYSSTRRMRPRRSEPRKSPGSWCEHSLTSRRAPPAQRAKKIAGKLVRALIALPVAVTGECEIEDYHSLAVRDLQRGQGVGLPSGESLARHMGSAPPTAEQVGIASSGWRGETPLWFYILREADACTGGSLLGPVGGRIVAEVLVGLIYADATSFRDKSQGWKVQKTLSELLAS